MNATGQLTLPPLEERTEWRRSQSLARQTSITHVPRCWKMNHGRHTIPDGSDGVLGEMWQGEEEELISLPEIRVASWTATSTSRKFKQHQYDCIREIRVGDTIILHPKTLRKVRGEGMRKEPKLKDYIRIGTVASCTEDSASEDYPGPNGVSGLFRFQINWDIYKIDCPEGHPLRRLSTGAGRGKSIIEIPSHLAEAL
jgi:hypothetical protein